MANNDDNTSLMEVTVADSAVSEIPVEQVA